MKWQPAMNTYPFFRLFVGARNHAHLPYTLCQDSLQNLAWPMHDPYTNYIFYKSTGGSRQRDKISVIWISSISMFHQYKEFIFCLCPVNFVVSSSRLSFHQNVRNTCISGIFCYIRFFLCRPAYNLIRLNDVLNCKKRQLINDFKP